MKKIVNNKTYPGNVIYAVFGDYAEGYAYYFDPVSAECDIEDIMLREFDDADRKVFYSEYKDGKSKRDIANEIKSTEGAVDDIIARILRRLRHPKRSKLLRDYVSAVRVFEDDGNKTASELVALCNPVDNTVAVVENGHVKALVLNVGEYDRLVQNAAITEKWEKEAKQKIQSESDIFRKALRLIIDKGTVSTILLQRELSIGYAHAGRIIDEMEQYKFISPHIPDKKREVYITEEQYYKLFEE